MPKIMILCLSFIASLSFAQNPILKVATTTFSPPFIMQGKNQLFGFDITLAEYICTSIQRDCQYQIVPFDEILNLVAKGEADIAIGSITITESRAQLVNFSIPYMLSKTRFLGLKELANKPFTNKVIQNSSIGVEKGTIFSKEIVSLGILNPAIVTFNDETSIIEALVSQKIDLAFTDEPTAIYWQIHSGGKIVALGKPYIYGYGYGIAINRKNLNLLKQINQSILNYQNSNLFKINYNIYFAYF